MLRVVSPWHSAILSDSTCLATEKQKADVAEHPKVFDHVGLLASEPPGMAGLLSIESSDKLNRSSSEAKVNLAYGSPDHSIIRPCSAERKRVVALSGDLPRWNTNVAKRRQECGSATKPDLGSAVKPFSEILANKRHKNHCLAS